MIEDFKKFVLRGNAVDLAIAVLIGTAFNSIVTSLTKNLITPLITAIIGNKADFASYAFKLHGTVFNYGQVINAIVSFVLIAAIVFFLVVHPINKMVAFSKRNKPLDPTDKKCPECLSTIPLKATRCAFCTAKLKV